MDSRPRQRQRDFAGRSAAAARTQLMPEEISLPRRLCAWLLRLAGWSVHYRWPTMPKCVVIFYPHTSNWDFVIGMLAYLSVGWTVRWCGKDTLFRPPLGALMRALGGIAVNRRERSGFVAQFKREFERVDSLYLAIAPEGTRAHTDHWRSGFYHLALAAGVPLGLAYIDYPNRRIGLDTYIDLAGDERADMARIRAYYADKRGRNPAQQGDIRFIPGGDRR